MASQIYPPGQQLPSQPPSQTEPPAIAPPPPPPPTPLDPPVVYYNQLWRVPPLVVDTQEAADALDPNEWTTGGPPAAQASAPTKPKDQWPKLYYNVNVEPKIVGDAKEAKALGEEWHLFTITDDLAKAAMVNNAAKAQADAAKAQAQAQQQGQAQPQYPQYGQQQYPGQYPPTGYPPTGY